MKHIIKISVAAFVLFSVLVNHQAKAQKTILFKMKYLPAHSYSSVMKMDVNAEINFNGDTASTNKLKTNGSKKPMLMQMQMNTFFDVKTGNSISNQTPVIMTLGQTDAKMKMNGKEQPLPMHVEGDRKIYGKLNSEGKLNIDSISGKKLTDSLKEVMKQAINNVQRNIIYPDKPMKIGDTFTQDIPMNMPIGGNSIKMISRTTYKLIGIEDNKAFFDMSIEMLLDMDSKKFKIDINGDGNGKMIYDVTNSYPVNIQSNIKLNYAIAVQQAKNLSVLAKANMLMDMQTTIQPN